MAKKEISRRDFIKGMVAGAVGVASMGVLTGCDYRFLGVEDPIAAEKAAQAAAAQEAIAAAAVVGIAAAAGALAMGLAVSKSTESMARQPETAGQINSSMMLGMVFIETAIIYALIVAILIIFVL